MPTTNCRHCGAARPDSAAIFKQGDDWLCPACDGYQDTIACPTCHQPARISLLDAGLVPAAHAPAEPAPEPSDDNAAPEHQDEGDAPA